MKHGSIGIEEMIILFNYSQKATYIYPKQSDGLSSINVVKTSFSCIKNPYILQQKLSTVAEKYTRHYSHPWVPILHWGL